MRWILCLVWLVACSGGDGKPQPEGCDPVRFPVCEEGVLTECIGGEEVDAPCPDGCNLAADACNTCLPGAVWCEDGFLNHCQVDGESINQSVCDLGCNEDRLECNLCSPLETTCVGADLVTCGSDGTVATTFACPFGCTDPDSIGPTPGVCTDDCDDVTDCDDDNPCTRDSCVPDSVGIKSCKHVDDDTLVPDDSLACTVDTCSGGVEQHANNDGACNDSVPCTVDSCDPADVRADADGCLFTGDDPFCSDGYACTGVEQCSPSDPGADGSGCVDGSANPTVCDDAVDCTDDACIGAGGDGDGCENVPNDGNCTGEGCSATLDCQPWPTVSGVSPDHGIAGVGVDGVVISGMDLATDAVVTVGGVDLPTTDCDYAGVPSSITCDLPGGNAGTVDLTVTNPSGLDDTLSTAFTWTTIATDADFCTIQWPRGHASAVGVAVDHYGQIWEPGLTDASSTPAAGILGEHGLSPVNPTGVDADPTQSPAWTWTAAAPTATYDFSQANDEYELAVTPTAVGSYRYAWRFSLDGGASYNYCDADDANSGFVASAVSTWTVSP